jgi:hypothetical protein
MLGATYGTIFVVTLAPKLDKPVRVGNHPPYKIHLPCKPLCYCLTDLPAGQYQRGLQPSHC